MDRRKTNLSLGKMIEAKQRDAMISDAFDSSETQLLEDIDFLRKKMSEKEGIPMTFKNEVIEKLASIGQKISKEAENNRKCQENLTNEVQGLKKEQAIQADLMQTRMKELQMIRDLAGVFSLANMKAAIDDFSEGKPVIFHKWNFLPPELKMECIQRMKFKSRLNLRKSSRLERKLVDEAKFNYWKVAMYDSLYFIDSGEEDDHYLKGDPFPLLKYILKTGTVDEFIVSLLEEDEIADAISVLKKFCPFSVKRLNFRGLNRKTLEFFLKNAGDNRLDMIELYPCFTRNYDDMMLEMLKIPSVIHAKLLLLFQFTTNDITKKLIETWIKHDVAIGQKLRILTDVYRQFEGFGDNFKDRIVSSKNNEYRIRTDDKSKHIVIRSLNEYSENALSCFVIPSDCQKIEKEDGWYEQLSKEYKNSLSENYVRSDSDEDEDSYDDEETEDDEDSDE